MSREIVRPRLEGVRNFVSSSSPGDGVWLWDFPVSDDSCCWGGDASVSDADKQRGYKVPTMVLSETRGL
jgi:hypothetical protein